MKSFSQEEINIWFKNLEGHSRIELMCTLLDSCLPLELRFLGTYLEYAAGKHYTHLQKWEKDANSKNTVFFNNLSDQETRRRLCIFLALLHSHNKIAALNLFDVLNDYNIKRETECLSSYSDNSEGENVEARKIDKNLSEKTSRNEMKLLLTMGSFHPAFNFRQRQDLRKKLLEFVSNEKQSLEHLDQKCKEGNLIDFETVCSVENLNHVMEPTQYSAPVSKVLMPSLPAMHNEMFPISNGFPFHGPLQNAPVYIPHPPLVVEQITDRIMSPINKQFSVYIPIDQPMVASTTLIASTLPLYHNSETHINKLTHFNYDKSSYVKPKNSNSESILQSFITENIENNNVDNMQCKNIFRTDDVCSTTLCRTPKMIHLCQNSEPNVNGIDNLAKSKSFQKKLENYIDVSTIRISHSPIVLHSQPINNFSYTQDVSFTHYNSLFSSSAFNSPNASVFPKIMNSGGKLRNGYAQQSVYVDHVTPVQNKAAVNSTYHIREPLDSSTANVFQKSYHPTEGVDTAFKKHSSEEPPYLSPCGSPIVSPHSSPNESSSVCLKNNFYKDPISCANWLKSLRLHKYHSKLKGYSFKTMKELSDEELCQLGLTKGARARFRLNIDLLRQQGFEEFADPSLFDVMVLNDSIMTPNNSLISTSHELSSSSSVDDSVAMLLQQNEEASHLLPENKTVELNGKDYTKDQDMFRKTAFIDHATDLKDDLLHYNFSAGSSNSAVSSNRFLHATCYNCGYLGHYGDECTEQTMESQTYSRYAFHLDFARNADILSTQDVYDESLTSR